MAQRRSGHLRQHKFRTQRIPHVSVPLRARLRTGKIVHGEALPAPESLGVGSMLEVKVYLVLKKHGIPFRTQVNFDGGSAVLGGQRADFVLSDRPIIIEALGPWHDLPGSQIRDERKWEARRKEGLEVVTIKDSEAVTLEQTEQVLMSRLGTPVGES